MDVQHCLRVSDVLADASQLPVTDCSVLVNGSLSLRAKVRHSAEKIVSFFIILRLRRQAKSRDLTFRAKGQDVSQFPVVISAAALGLVDRRVCY